MSRNEFMPLQEKNVEKETIAEDVDFGKNINEKEINLNEQTSNITITESGVYTLLGEFKYSVLINADDEVTLNLKNVTITSNETSAIANISTNALIINLLEKTSFTADENFKTLIISNEKLTSGKYVLYDGEEKISDIYVS